MGPKSVFVIGAGASCSYGYPSGYDLKTSIIKDSLDPLSELSKVLSSFKRVEVEAFAKAFSLSKLFSIDSFLQENSHFQEIGKTAIVFMILSKMKIVSSYDGKDDWYSYLFNKVIYPSIKQDRYDIAFLSFNYDLTLEEQLIVSIKNTFNLSFKDAFLKFKKIKIHHVYGCVSELEEVDEEIFKKCRELDLAKSCVEISSKIKVMHDDRQKIPDEWMAALTSCDYICFLGFAYDMVNIDRLKTNWDDSGGKIIGSSYMLTSDEASLIRKKLGNAVGITHHTTHKCLDFLRHNLSRLAEEYLV